METENGTASSGETQSANASATETGAAQTQAQGNTGASETRGAVSSKPAGGAGNDGAAQSATGAAQAEVEAYAPNFKFKVKDKELEFEDHFKSIIKTKDLEAKIREMHEKAYGLDEVKTARDTFKTQAKDWEDKYSQVENSLKTLGTYVKKGDYLSFFSALNIPEDKIIQYAVERLKYRELPADQKAQLDAQRQQQMEYEQATNQNQTLQQQMAQLVQQQATFDLNQELAKPDVVSTIAAYDARAGKAGAFRQEVIRRGQYYEAVHQISLPASQLVGEVMSLIGVPAPQTPQGSQGGPQAEVPSQVVHAAKEKPVIPTFQGGAKSPIKKVPSSIDDLRKMRDAL